MCTSPSPKPFHGGSSTVILCAAHTYSGINDKITSRSTSKTHHVLEYFSFFLVTKTQNKFMKIFQIKKHFKLTLVLLLALINANKLF